MAEFHMLPSLKRESELISTTTTTATTANNSKNPNGSEPYDDEYEQWMIQHWDRWNEQAMQRTLHQSRITTATMPSLDHLTYQDFRDVYEPSDDTYLLLDAIQYDLSTNHQPQLQNEMVKQDTTSNDSDVSNDTMRVPICLEIGCGSGVVSAYFRTYWLDLERCQRKERSKKQRTFLISYVTDINPKALQITYRTFQQAMKKSTRQEQVELLSGTPDEWQQQQQQQNQHTSDTSIGQVEYVLCDIATPLLHRLHQKVSYIICNPPYVPSCDSEIGLTDITAAYAGGRNGRRVIDRIVPQIIQLLEVSNGIAYLVTVDENLPLQLAIQIYQQQRQQLKDATSTDRVLQMKPFFRKRAKNEFLTIQKITYIDYLGSEV